MFADRSGSSSPSVEVTAMVLGDDSSGKNSEDQLADLRAGTGEGCHEARIHGAGYVPEELQGCYSPGDDRARVDATEPTVGRRVTSEVGEGVKGDSRGGGHVQRVDR